MTPSQILDATVEAFQRARLGQKLQAFMVGVIAGFAALATLGNELRTRLGEAIVQGNTTREDVASLRLAFNGLLTKLDSDDGVTDLDYMTTLRLDPSSSAEVASIAADGLELPALTTLDDD